MDMYLSASDAGVYLKTSADWATWIAFARETATFKGVWDWCNPDTPDTERPVYMTRPTFGPRPGIAATTEEKENYLRDAKITKYALSEWDRWNDGMEEMRLFVYNSVDRSHHLAILNCPDLFLKFKYLKSRFGNQKVHKCESRAKWHQNASKKSRTKMGNMAS